MAFYQAALAVFEPLVWRYFGRRGQGDAAYLEHLDERRGRGAAFASDVWVHAVSLGEYRSAEPAIVALLERGYRVVLTHATPAGRQASETALAEGIDQGQVRVCYAPVDRVRYWRRFFDVYRPRLGLVFEMEFWPGMTEAAAGQGISLWFVNSQIPGKSFKRALSVFRVIGRHPAARGARVLAKSDRMADRFRSLGAKDVTVMGETRFDVAPPTKQVDVGLALKTALGEREVYVFASVVAGEEPMYLAAARRLCAETGALVIWVPRAPENFDNTEDFLVSAGLRVLRRSVILGAEVGVPDGLDGADVFLGDSFGEMFFYLASADVVSVGGGFVEKGAHNVIEPLALGKPVVTGPHVWTIEFPGTEAAEAGILSICEAPELADAMQQLRKTGVDGARAFHSRYAGATGRLVENAVEQMGPPQ